VKIVALLQTYNEERFIGQCLDHLDAHGISVYLVDNESTDETVRIAEQRTSKNVIGIETLRRDGHFALVPQLVRKEELAQTLEADWFMHLDADEFRVSPERGETLAEAFERAEAEGFNAINFLEFAFVPTREAPDHDNPDYLTTMRSYYPILPRFPHRLNAWKRQDGAVELAPSGGHVARFPGLRLSPRSLYSRHYVVLSPAHAARKYGPGRFSAEELELGWHAWRASPSASEPDLLSERELRSYVADHLLDPSNPRKHPAELLGSAPAARRGGRRRARRIKRLLEQAGLRGRGRSSQQGPRQSISS
jgi:glycosyltransferase involved in cell wall biosynthesis